MITLQILNAFIEAECWTGANDDKSIWLLSVAINCMKTKQIYVTKLLCFPWANCLLDSFGCV